MTSGNRPEAINNSEHRARISDDSDQYDRSTDCIARVASWGGPSIDLRHQKRPRASPLFREPILIFFRSRKTKKGRRRLGAPRNYRRPRVVPAGIKSRDLSFRRGWLKLARCNAGGGGTGGAGRHPDLFFDCMIVLIKFIMLPLPRKSCGM